MQFISHDLVSFLEKWGVKHRKSAPYNPHANLRAETAVKSAKRILTLNTKSDGSPNWDSIKRALLQHRNTPVQDLAISPAQMLFGRPIRDHLPVKPGLFQPSEVWVTARDQRELALRHRVAVGKERWAEHTKALPDLKPGQNVFIENQQGAGKLSRL